MNKNNFENNKNDYIAKIQMLISKINKNLINFDEYTNNIKKQSIQINSEYLIKIEENTWAKNTLIKSFNNTSHYKATLEDDDIIIYNNSNNAVFAIKVYCAPFIFDKYNTFMLDKKNFYANRALLVKDKILSMHYDLLYNKNKELLKLIEAINKDNLDIISFKLPNWKTSVELEKVSERIKELDEAITDRNNIKLLTINITKEDLQYAYNFIKNYNTTYYYVYVFFDKAFIISFERVLELISNSNLEDSKYFIENINNSIIIKIIADDEEVILENIEFPKYTTMVKELENGMIVSYSHLGCSNATLNESIIDKL